MSEELSWVGDLFERSIGYPLPKLELRQGVHPLPVQ